MLHWKQNYGTHKLYIRGGLFVAMVTPQTLTHDHKLEIGLTSAAKIKQRTDLNPDELNEAKYQALLLAERELQAGLVEIQAAIQQQVALRENAPESPESGL